MHRVSLIVVLFLAAPLAAQENVETPSQKTKEAVNKLLRAPSAVKKSLLELGEAAKTKLQGAVAETKPNPDSPPPAERKADPPAEAPRLGPAAKRDPFRPFTLGVRSNVRRRENLSPLERYELGQLKLVAVIWDPKDPTAMVEDSGGLGYVVKVGTPIGANDGKVKVIKRDGITIEEFYVDLYGAKKRREVNMKIVAEGGQ